MTTELDRRRTTGRRAALVVLAAAVTLVTGAPLAAAAPPDHARPAGKHAEHDVVGPDSGPVEADDAPDGERGKRADAPGQATTPGRSADAPGRATPPEPPSEPPKPAEPAPRPEPEPEPDRGTPDPAPVAPRPPERPTPPRGRTAPPPATATSGADGSPAPADEPAGAATPAEAPAEPPASDRAPGGAWSAFDLLRGALRAAGDSAEAIGADVAGSVGSATSDAARRLTASLGHTEPYAPRDLGVPMGVLLLFGGYLAVSRWLDRGALPMAISEGQGDDVQHVL